MLTREPETLEFLRENNGRWALRAVQRVGITRSDLFPFFANAANLARITPPELRFHTLTPEPIAMHEGATIDYEIRLWGVPMSWRTEITLWNPPQEFVDTQLRGPYAEWVHRHRFIELTPDATLVEDYVRFRLPLGRLGMLTAPIVRRQLRRIFDYRRGVIARLAYGSTPGL